MKERTSMRAVKRRTAKAGERRKPPRERDQPPLVDLSLYNVPGPKRKPPKWILEEPIVTVGAWEPLFHRRRCGGDWVNVEETFSYEHSEDFVLDLKRIGCNILITSFEKNYQIDEDELVLKKQLARHCRKHGLRLAAYIRADQATREIFPNGPAGEGYSLRADGQIPCYSFQEWRRYVCMHNPAVVEKLKGTVRRAIEELRVDAILFDGFGFGGTEGIDACRCDRCRADFREFLILRYGKNAALAKERFGHAYLDRIEPPGTIAFPPIPTGRVLRPDWQEWISFRSTWSTMLARRITEYVYQLNPEVAVLTNSPPAVKENMPLMCGQDTPTLFQGSDALFCEDAYDPGITDAGRVIHRTRQMKMAHAARAWLINYVDHGEDDRTLWMHMAHDAAFNHGRITHIGFSPYHIPPDFHNAFTTKQKFISWLKDHWDMYQHLEPVHEFTVWRSQAGLAFAEALAYAEFVQMEQLLVEERIPFEIASDDCLNHLDEQSVLIIPAVECMTASQGKKIISFVRRGGGLLIGGNTSLFDGWYHRRQKFLLAPLMEKNIENPYCKDIPVAGQAFTSGTQTSPESGIQYFCSGRGRMAYVQRFIDPKTQPNPITVYGAFDVSLDHTNWRRPERAEEILTSLRWLARNRYRFKVDAPRGVLAEYYYQASARRYMVHLVNLHLDRVARNVVVRMNTGKRESVLKAEVLSPDEQPPAEVKCRVDAHGVAISIGKMCTYTVIAISLRK